MKTEINLRKFAYENSGQVKRMYKVNDFVLQRKGIVPMRENILSTNMPMLGVLAKNGVVIERKPQGIDLNLDKLQDFLNEEKKGQKINIDRLSEAGLLYRPRDLRDVPTTYKIVAGRLMEETTENYSLIIPNSDKILLEAPGLPYDKAKKIMDIWLDEDVNFVSTPSWNEIARGKLVMMDFAKTQEMFGGRGNAINFVMDYASNKGEIVLFDILVMPFETKKDFYTGEDITKSVQCLCVLPHREE